MAFCYIAFVEKNLELSIVIPIHNESNIVADSVAGLCERLPAISSSFEILLCENGSTDGTGPVLQELEHRHQEVSHLHLEQANYGMALRQGILRARGTFVVCDEIDLCDTGFYQRSLDLLRSGQAEMVVGSKLAPGARDDRPWLRHLATQVLNGLLRWTVGFQGTDTHGLKAFRREPLLPTVENCVLDGNLFASELVIRAQRDGKMVVELPLDVHEKRRPTINLFKRVPRALVQVGRLTWVLRVSEKSKTKERPS
jgi:glycosyltransferase involved in cell wall biosynthesis